MGEFLRSNLTTGRGVSESILPDQGSPQGNSQNARETHALIESIQHKKRSHKQLWEDNLKLGLENIYCCELLIFHRKY